MARRVKVLALVVALAGLLGSCTPSNYDLASNKRLGVYLKVPNDWVELSQDQLVPLYAEGDEQPSPEGYRLLKQVLWERAWDSSPRPSPDHLRLGQANAPVARVNVRALTDEQREGVSSGSLRTVLRSTYIEDVQSFLQTLSNPSARELVSADFIPLQDEELQPEGYYGWRQLYDVRNPDDQSLYRTAFIVLLNEARTILYTLTVHCNRSCFVANQPIIEKVLDSFTVRKPLT